MSTRRPAFDTAAPRSIPSKCIPALSMPRCAAVLSSSHAPSIRTTPCSKACAAASRSDRPENPLPRHAGATQQAAVARRCAQSISFKPRRPANALAATSSMAHSQASPATVAAAVRSIQANAASSDGSGIVLRARIAGSRQILASAAASDSANGRRRTTPSVKVGTWSTSPRLAPRSTAIDGYRWAAAARAKREPLPLPAWRPWLRRKCGG